MKSRFAKRGLASVSIFALLSFGACSIALPDMVFTNGVSEVGNAGAHDIQASASAEFLFSVIGLNETSGTTARTENRDSLSKQCAGGKLENLSESSVIQNYYIYSKITYTEHATCVMPKG